MVERIANSDNRGSVVRRFVAACLLGSASCTLVVDTDAVQCETRDDCSEFPGTICLDHACIVATPGTPGECRNHADCASLRDDPWICRASDAVCVPLLSEHCQTLLGDYQNDQAIFLGSLLQTKGESATTGLPVENAIRLAIKDFEQAGNGLPPAPGRSARRPLVLIGCNSGVDPIAAARHLTNVVQVPAIIGASFSGVTIQVATEVTIPGKTLLLSPSATSAAITQLQDDNLVWRTAPSDDLQAAAVQQFVPRVEAHLREDLSLSDEPIRLAIAYKGDSYGRGLTDTVESALSFNGKPVAQNKDNYLRLDYGNPTAEALARAVEELLAFEPHIVLIFGSTGGVTGVFKPLEEQWANPQYRPRYIFSDGGVVNELWMFVNDDDELRRRIRGTVPGTDNALFRTFRSSYNAVFDDGTSPDVFGAAGGYDAVYLLAYAAVSIGSKKITGPNLVEGLKIVAASGNESGQALDVGLNFINDAFATIASGQALNFEGASGPLDFDVQTGEALSDIQVWCLPKDKNGQATAAVASGLFLNAKTGMLAGEEGTICD